MFDRSEEDYAALRKRFARLRARTRVLDRLPLCPDHRDKVLGRPCLACEGERLLEALKAIAHRTGDVEVPEAVARDTMRGLWEVATAAIAKAEDAKGGEAPKPEERPPPPACPVCGGQMHDVSTHQGVQEAEGRMKEATVLAIDPGFDRTGWAVFELSGGPATLNDAVAGLWSSGEVATDPTWGHAHRCGRITLGLEAVLRERCPVLAYLEMPSYEGSYTGGRERQAGVNRLHMAIGAIMSTLDRAGIPVVPLPAIRTPKAIRHELLEAAARTEGVELPRGPRGGLRPDAWDAIWLGASALLERGRKDLEGVERRASA